MTVPTRQPVGRVLFVEDDQDVTKSMIRWFKLHDWTPIHFSSVKPALQALKKEPFNLVFTDWNLFGDTSEPLVREALKQGIPVRICSGRDAPKGLGLEAVWLSKSGDCLKQLNTLLEEIGKGSS